MAHPCADILDGIRGIIAQIPVPENVTDDERCQVRDAAVIAACELDMLVIALMEATP